MSLRIETLHSSPGNDNIIFCVKMLPSKCHFSTIPCVFFLDGCCRRPHCHYRHSYQDVVPVKVGPKNLPPPVSSDPTATQKCWSPAQINLVTKLVENAVDNALRVDPSKTTQMPRSTLVKNTLEKLFSDPEALKMASSRKLTRHAQSVPSYRPTPISELSTSHVPVLCVPEKPYSSLIKWRRENRIRSDAANQVCSMPKAHLSQAPNELCIEHTADCKFSVETSNPPDPIFNKELNPKGCCSGSGKELQDLSEHGNVRLECHIPLKRLVDFEFEKSSLNKTHEESQSKKKLKLSTKGLPRKKYAPNGEISSVQIPAEPLLLKPELNQPKVIVDVEMLTKKDAPINSVESRNVQSSTLMKKPEQNTLKVSSSTDPFSRWMKNKKIRQILGKDKRLKDSRNRPSLSTLLPAQKLPEEELPEPKTAKRVAHKHDQYRPVPIGAEDVKIPSSFRHHFCSAFFEEFRKTMKFDEAKKRALEEELQVAKSAKNGSTYKNNCSLLIVKFRRGVEEKASAPEELTPASCPDFTYGWSLYQAFSSYLLSDNELRDNGYPMVVPNKPNCAYIDKNARRYSVQQPEKSFHKICTHCSGNFQVDESGMPTSKDDCYYHWGKLLRTQYKGQMVEKFTCCGGSVDSAPCEFSSYHVWSGLNEDCMEDFVETTKLPSYMEDHEAGIYALDCEMCYTTKGLELARLTVLDLNGRTVFDEVISMKNPILNYCTLFSGIDARKIASATYTFDDVKRWVLEHFYDKTILVGHSLENDLKAMRLIHRTVVDTSVTFPHKFGPPNKMSLKHLANVVLELNIQENVDGHDSKEDAATCLKLMMKKILEDSKARKPRVIINYHGRKK